MTAENASLCRADADRRQRDLSDDRKIEHDGLAVDADLPEQIVHSVDTCIAEERAVREERRAIDSGRTSVIQAASAAALTARVAPLEQAAAARGIRYVAESRITANEALVALDAGVWNTLSAGTDRADVTWHTGAWVRDAVDILADPIAAIAATALIVGLANAVADALDAFGVAFASARASLERDHAVSAGADSTAVFETAITVQAVIGRIRAIAIRLAGRWAIPVGRRAALARVDTDAVATLLGVGVAAEIPLGHPAGEGAFVATDIGFFVAGAVAAATDCATALHVLRVLAALRRPTRDLAVHMALGRATVIPAAITAVAGAGAATIDVAAGIRDRATRRLIGNAGEEVARGETFLIAADLIRAAFADAKAIDAGYATTGARITFRALGRARLSRDADRARRTLAADFSVTAARVRKAALARYADARPRFSGATDLVRRGAALYTRVGAHIALQARIAAIAVVATGAWHALRAGRTLADDMRRRQTSWPRVRGAAQLLAIARALATGVVATFAVTGSAGGNACGAARRTNTRIALRAPRWTRTNPTDRDLITGAFGWRWCRSWTARRVGITLQRHSTGQRRTAQPKDPFEHGAAAPAGGQRLDQRIETFIVHSPNLS
jgi:hypothetical protein